MGLQTIGILLDGIAAFGLIVVEFKPIKEAITPTSLIEDIDRGQETLLIEGELSPDDRGFDAVVEALEGYVEMLGPVKEIVVVDPYMEPDVVEIRFETSGDSIHSKGDPLPRTLINEYIGRHVRELERKKQERVLAIVGGVLFLGFALQLIAALN